MMKLLISLVLLYGGVLMLLCLLQRSYIYYPYRIDRQRVFPPYAPGQEELFITCADGCTINGLFVPGKHTMPAVLIFHGNGGNITHRDFIIRAFSRLGYPTLLIDYHGYGKSEGKPSEKNLYLDGEASLEWLMKQKHFRPDEVVLYGESLGGGVAVELATRYTCKGLILVSTFASLASIARSHFPFNCFPVNLMLLDRFDNLSKIAGVDAPLLFLHGTEDEIVDPEESVALFETATAQKKIRIFEGADHNGLPFHDPGTYWTVIADWLEALNTPR